MPYLTPDDSGGAYVCRRIRFRAELAGAITGALETLTKDYTWEAFGDLTPDQTALLALEALNDYLDSGDRCMIGTLVWYWTQDPPYGTLPLDGGVYLGSDYPELYAKLHTSFKNPAGHFTLSRMAGRTLVAAGVAEDSSTWGINDSGGQPTVELELEHLPIHSHSYEKITPTISPIGEIGGIIAIDDINTEQTGEVGDGVAHDNMPPWQGAGIAIYYR